MTTIQNVKFLQNVKGQMSVLAKCSWKSTKVTRILVSFMGFAITLIRISKRFKELNSDVSWKQQKQESG